MKTHSFLVTAVAISFPIMVQCSRNESGETAQPSATQRVQAPVSPQVHPDRTVTFSILAPSADSVRVNVSGLPAPAVMTRDTLGIWSATVGPLEPEIWEYSFVVDGVSMIDPGNAWLDERLRPASSMVAVSGGVPMPYDIRDEPHGVVAVHTFKSPALGELRTFHVYTRPDTTGQGRIPTRCCTSCTAFPTTTAAGSSWGGRTISLTT